MHFRHFPTLDLLITDKLRRDDLKLPATHGVGVEISKKAFVLKKE